MIGMRESIHERYGAELSALDRTAFEEFVTAKTAELEQQIDQLAQENRIELTRRWESENSRQIGYLDQVQVNQQAQQSAYETVMGQLWEGVETTDQAGSVETTPAMQRWDTPEATAPTPEIEDLVGTVWPSQSRETRFRVLAGDLLQARDEDNLPLPTTPDDPLAIELGALLTVRVEEIAAAVDE
ncbi:hypothetical protein [Skermania sp. ID1734]|uniref:hypothetical protein n=1 Tax=Skermania sp. ID1734 TaxID=2597516 RepID=UPI00163D63A4|nr:hypothetical protein [Skermania sp. ID1734]